MPLASSYLEPRVSEAFLSVRSPKKNMILSFSCQISEDFDSLLNLITNNVSGVLNEEDVGGRQSKTGGENHYKINHRSEVRQTRKK